MVTALGRLDPVELRVVVGGVGGGPALGVRGGGGRLLGQGGGRRGRLLLLLAEEPPGVCCAAAAAGRWFPSSCCPSCDRPGVKLAAVAPTSSRAATSCRASSWLGPAPGTRFGSPTPDRAAFTSTSTHAVNWAQASQTTTVSVLMNVSTLISFWSQSRLGEPLGSGHPICEASAPGTPISSTSRATKARNAFRKSPNVRRRRGRGCGVRFLGPGELPVELEVVRRAMAGVLVSCVEGGRAGVC